MPGMRAPMCSGASTSWCLQARSRRFSAAPARATTRCCRPSWALLPFAQARCASTALNPSTTHTTKSSISGWATAGRIRASSRACRVKRTCFCPPTPKLRWAGPCRWQNSTRRRPRHPHGTESSHHTHDKIQHLGVGYCGADTGIFTGLSCEENLLLPSNTEDTLGGGMSLAEIYELLPNLYPRRHMPCTRLSGGEQQMLAIARILRTGANLLLLDNIADGLAPVMVQNLANMIDQLRNMGYTLLLIEQTLDFPSGLADCFYIMHEGQVVDRVAPDSLASRQDAFVAVLGS